MTIGHAGGHSRRDMGLGNGHLQYWYMYRKQLVSGPVSVGYETKFFAQCYWQKIILKEITSFVNVYLFVKYLCQL